MNPELTHWTGPQGLPRFDLIEDSDFAPAFDKELAGAEAAIEAIAANPEPASFENTVATMELAEDGLNRVLSVFYNLVGVDSNPASSGIAARLRAPPCRLQQPHHDGSPPLRTRQGCGPDRR